MSGGWFFVPGQLAYMTALYVRTQVMYQIRYEIFITDCQIGLITP